MPRQTDQQRGRMIRIAVKGLRIKPRRIYDPSLIGYLESDRDFVLNNIELAIALLEAIEARAKEGAV